MQQPSLLSRARTALDARTVLLSWAVFFYIGHIIFQAKIAGSELGAFGLIFVLCWSMAKKEMRPSWHILYVPLALYGIASSLSALAAEQRLHNDYLETTLWFKMLIFPAVVMFLRELPRVKDLVVRTQLFFGSGVAVIGIYQYLLQDRRELENRITGLSTHVMTYSGLLLPLAVFALVLWVYQRQWWQGAAMLLMTLALLLTFTRSAWLGWVLAVFTLLLLRRPRWMFFAAPALILFVALAPMDIFGRMVSIFDRRQESNLDRIRMVEAGIEIIRDHPLLGVGPANVKEFYPLYRAADSPRFRVPHLHNNVVQLWAERGVLGLVAYLLLLILFLRECVRGWRGPGRMWADAGVGVVVALTVAGLFEFNFGDTEVFYLTLELFALVVVQLEAARTPAPSEAASTV